MAKALFGGFNEDYGPCSCGEYRATVPVAIPAAWVEEGEVPQELDFPFALGYDYRRIFGAVRRGDYYLNFSACPRCCERAERLGVAEEVEDVGFSSNALVEGILGAVEG